MHISRPGARAVIGIALVGAGITVAACGSAQARPPAGARVVLNVVAAENTWGSLAGQLGGRQVHVLSLLRDPNADPHQFEGDAADARALARANLVVVNGAGYDGWATKMLAAGPSPGRRVLSVARLVGTRPGENPHLWYDPVVVTRAANALTAEYETLEPAERAYFAARHRMVMERLAGLFGEMASIRAHHRGAKVAATESIFVYLARYLRLDLVTPPAFMDAISAGTDPPAQALAEFSRQIAHHAFGVLVYNVQTVTPLTSGLVSEARSQGISVVPVSETIIPRQASYEAWMGRQIRQLAAALAERPA